MLFNNTWTGYKNVMYVLLYTTGGTNISLLITSRTIKFAGCNSTMNDFPVTPIQAIRLFININIYIYIWHFGEHLIENIITGEQ